MEDIKQLWKAFQDNPDADVDGLGTFDEYGLSFDYVAAGTFKEQDVGYFRWQLSWGGPSDEFRYYADPDLNLSTLDYWFLDWFDGASLKVERNSEAWYTLHDIWDMWNQCPEVLRARMTVKKWQPSPLAELAGRFATNNAHTNATWNPRSRFAMLDG